MELNRQLLHFIFFAIVELYHGVKRGARNGIDTSDWVCPPLFKFMSGVRPSILGLLCLPPKSSP